MEKKAKDAGGGIWGRFVKGKMSLGMEGFEEAMWRRNNEMAKALETMNRAGGRGGMASGNSGMDMRCTTLDEKGESGEGERKAT
jgi:hypothetical protein